MGSYRIVRFYADDRPSKVMQVGLTLEEAQAHCNDPSTREAGVWFEGYSQFKGGDPWVY